MPPAPRPALPEGPGALILGPCGADVVLVSLHDRPSPEWPAHIRRSVPDGVAFGAWGLTGAPLHDACAMGAVLVGRPVPASTFGEVLADLGAAAAHGSVVALMAGDDTGPVPTLVDALLADGVDASSFVVEVPLGSTTRNHPGASVVADLVGRGIRVGVALADRPEGSEAEVSGWEIGVLTTALLDGATLVRGVELRRAARIRAVVDALRGGGES